MDPTALYTTCQLTSANENDHSECPEAGPQHTKIVLEQQLIDKNKRGWRRIALNFTPSWFAVTMGTGIVSILLHNLPYNGTWLYWISVILFCVNILLFVLFTLISVVRYTYFKGLFVAMLRHPVQSLFLGTFPMGLATIINMIVFVCVPIWGQRAITLAWTLWWLDATIALTICMSLPFAIMTLHDSELKSMTAAWLLPIVSTIVAAATGGIVAELLTGPTQALWTLLVSYVLWGTGFPMAMIVLAMYFYRLTLFKVPPREVIVSVFLPLGPIGQGGFALLQLGKVALKVLPATGSLIAEAGPIFYVGGFFLALVMWGFGLVWLFFAVASISRSRFPFNMGWWGFTFPLGVYTVATVTLGKGLPSLFFRVLGTVLSVGVLLLWVVVSIGTLRGLVSGGLLFAPCAAEFEKIYVHRKAEEMASSKDAHSSV